MSVPGSESGEMTSDFPAATDDEEFHRVDEDGARAGRVRLGLGFDDDGRISVWVTVAVTVCYSQKCMVALHRAFNLFISSGE